MFSFAWFDYPRFGQSFLSMLLWVLSTYPNEQINQDETFIDIDKGTRTFECFIICFFPLVQNLSRYFIICFFPNQWKPSVGLFYFSDISPLVFIASILLPWLIPRHKNQIDFFVCDMGLILISAWLLYQSFIVWLMMS